MNCDAAKADRFEQLLQLLTQLVQRESDPRFLSLVDKCEYVEFAKITVPSTPFKFVPADPQRWCLVFTNNLNPYFVFPEITKFPSTGGLGDPGISLQISSTGGPIFLQYPDTLQLAQLGWMCVSSAGGINAGAYGVRWKG